MLHCWPWPSALTALGSSCSNGYSRASHTNITSAAGHPSALADTMLNEKAPTPEDYMSTDEDGMPVLRKLQHRSCQAGVCYKAKVSATRRCVRHNSHPHLRI